MGDPVERVAKIIAYWHGVQFTYRAPGGPTHTVASQAGSGQFSDAAERYSRERWGKYEDQARAAYLAALDDLESSHSRNVSLGYAIARKREELKETAE